jgi:transposase
MRELKAVWESDPAGQAWAEQMRQTLKKARRTVDTAIERGADSLSPTMMESLRDLYLNTAQQGVTANTHGTAGRSHDAYKLAKRMRERVDQVVYFTLDFDTEWTNNPAEQAIRMAKLQAKISGSWRSRRGLAAFCHIRSYIATAKAHGVEVFTALRNAFLGDPWSIPTAAWSPDYTDPAVTPEWTH